MTDFNWTYVLLTAPKCSYTMNSGVLDFAGKDSNFRNWYLISLLRWFSKGEMLLTGQKLLRNRILKKNEWLFKWTPKPLRYSEEYRWTSRHENRSVQFTIKWTYIHICLGIIQRRFDHIRLAGLVCKKVNHRNRSWDIILK